MVEIRQKWNCSGNHFCHLSHGRGFPNIFILFENVWQLSPRAEVGESNGKSFSKFLLFHHSKCHTKIKLENCAKFDFNLRSSKFQPPISELCVPLATLICVARICLFTFSNLNLVMKNKGIHCQRTQASQSLTSTSTLHDNFWWAILFNIFPYWYDACLARTAGKCLIFRVLVCLSPWIRSQLVL